ncbi:MAG: hypothetical protein WB421_06660 [Terriglobales bacterium]
MNEERRQSLVFLLKKSVKHLDKLERRLTLEPGLPLHANEHWLPGNIEFARRFALQYTGPGVPTLDSINQARDEINHALEENERNVTRPMNDMSRRIWLMWRTMGKKEFWNRYGPGSTFKFEKCAIPEKPVEIPSDNAPYSVYEDDWKEMSKDFPSSGVDWNLITRFSWTDDDKSTEWKTNMYGVMKNYLLYGLEPKIIRKRKRMAMEVDDNEDYVNIIEDDRNEGDGMYHRTMTNFRKMSKWCRYNIMDGEMYVIDYFPHPNDRDSIGRPIMNDVTSFKLRKYRIVPESERGTYLTCMWHNPTKGSHRTTLRYLPFIL